LTSWLVDLLSGEGLTSGNPTPVIQPFRTETFKDHCSLTVPQGLAKAVEDDPHHRLPAAIDLRASSFAEHKEDWSKDIH
jgi:hypothetical protein